MNQSKTRVIQILAGGNFGGAERSVQWFSQFTDRRIYDHHFIFLYSGGHIQNEIASMGYPTYLLDWKNGYSILGRLHLMRIIKKIDPHLIHDHDMTPFTRVFIRMATKSPIISSQHGLGLIKKHTIPFLRIDDRITQIVIANSQYTAKEYSSVFNRPYEKIKVIYLGINPDYYRLPEKKKEKNGKNPLQIAFIGRLEANKGVMDIPLLARVLSEKGENYYINIAGDGTLLESCKKLASKLGVIELINFLGFKEDIVNVLAHSDLLVFLSTSEEAFGLVLLEAIAAGVPVFAYSGGGVVEAIGNAPNSWLVPNGDYHKMADIIINKKEFCLGCDRSKGYYFVKEFFNIRRTVNDIETIYNQVVNNKINESRKYQP